MRSQVKKLDGEGEGKEWGGQSIKARVGSITHVHTLRNPIF